VAKPQRDCPRPARGRSLVEGAFRRAGLERDAREWRALAAWSRVAGPRLGGKTRAERVLRGSLIVRVESAAWANELGFLRTQLLEKLRATPGAEGIEELRFSIGPLAELPAWDDESPRSAPPPPAPEPPPIDDGAVTAALLQVRDPELRGALAELFARSRARR
jgi:hypothetical protein